VHHHICLMHPSHVLTYMNDDLNAAFATLKRSSNTMTKTKTQVLTSSPPKRMGIPSARIFCAEFISRSWSV